MLGHGRVRNCTSRPGTMAFDRDLPPRSPRPPHRRGFRGLRPGDGRPRARHRRAPEAAQQSLGPARQGNLGVGSIRLVAFTLSGDRDPRSRLHRRRQTGAWGTRWPLHAVSCRPPRARGASLPARRAPRFRPRPAPRPVPAARALGDSATRALPASPGPSQRSAAACAVRRGRGSPATRPSCPPRTPSTAARPWHPPRGRGRLLGEPFRSCPSVPRLHHHAFRRKIV